MRKTPLICILILLSTVLYAQPFGKAKTGYKITELRYQNSSGEKGTTLFRYDQQNTLVKAFWSLDNKKRYSTNYYEYDAHGNLISAFRDFSDGLTSFESFCYDSAGNKISERFRRSDSIIGAASYTYNKKNQLMQARYAKHKGWLNGILKLTYHGNQIKEGLLTNKDHILCRISYDYDSIGNLVREFWNFNGKWSQTFTYIYSKINQTRQFYSSPYLSGESNFRISKEEYTFNNEVGGPSLYFYNEAGLLAKKVFIRNDSLRTNTFYNYDQEGKLISSKRIYSDNTVARFTYFYDENSNLVKRNYLKADTLYGFESYLYNSDGELMKAYLKNFDGWLSGTITFETDPLGKITTGKFISENGFTATLLFNYDPERLLAEIIWNFSFGKFQKYRFEYTPVPSRPL